MTGGADRPRRSALFLPAANPRAIAKARTLPCDVVILDLEDAVAPEAKAAARDAAVGAAREGGWGARELVVRVNGRGSAWHEADIAALEAAPVDALLLPKVATPQDITAVRSGDRPVWAMIETCAAILRLAEIAAAPGLGAFVLGFNDLALEMRADPGPDRLPLQPVLALAVAAARAHGVAILDAVCNDFADTARFAVEAAQGRRFGCDGKTLIHPAQIAPANLAFGPSPEEVAEAAAIVAAFAAPGSQGLGAIRLRGRMVERLHLRDAERTLELAGGTSPENNRDPQEVG